MGMPRFELGLLAPEASSLPGWRTTPTLSHYINNELSIYTFEFLQKFFVIELFLYFEI